MLQKESNDDENQRILTILEEILKETILNYPEEERFLRDVD